EFALLLPAECAGASGEVPRPVPASTGTAEDEREEPAPSADFGGRRVLVVEPDLRRLLALTPVLERWGLQVVAAGDAEEALETLDEDGIALVLVSVGVSGTEAYATIGAMRQHARHQQVAVIALLPADDAAARLAAVAAGAADALPHPLDLAALRDLIAQHLADAAAA
ncbi:MAG: hypothetical protein RLZ44_1017, partial [Pseudomonadota bacterium]